MKPAVNLKVNDFHVNISNTFIELKEKLDFSDVTLACDEDQQIEAHKVVLSASSEFFKGILKKQKHSHPLLYLGNVSKRDLLKVLDFIYIGEVEIYQDDLERFISVAKRLQLNGLKDVNDFGYSDSSSLPLEDSLKVDSHGPHDHSYEEEQTSQMVIKVDDDCSVVNPTQECFNEDNTGIHEGENSFSLPEQGLEEIATIDYKVLITKLEFGFKCNLCDKLSKDRTNLRRHIRNSHFNIRH